MNEHFSPQTMVVAGRDQISCDVSGEAVILHIRDGVYYGLNPIGARVWQMLQEPTLVADIRARLLDEYQVDPGQCDQDLSALLLDLSSRKLIEVRHESDQKVSGSPAV